MRDLIDRKKAIDATWFEPSYTDPLNVLTEVRDRLEALPSAQPEIKCIAKIMLTDEQVQEAFEKAKKEILAAQPEHIAEVSKMVAQPEPQWIPCSERLPETDKEVFVYLWGDVPHLASVNDEGQWETDQFYLDADEAPKAWMPLPEPYKGGEQDG